MPGAYHWFDMLYRPAQTYNGTYEYNAKSTEIAGNHVRSFLEARFNVLIYRKIRWAVSHDLICAPSVRKWPFLAAQVIHPSVRFGHIDETTRLLNQCHLYAGSCNYPFNELMPTV